jgi:hypothetical protein
MSCKKTEETPSVAKLDALSLLTKTEFAENNTINKVIYLFAMSVNRTLASDADFAEEFKTAVNADKRGSGISIPNFADANPAFQSKFATNLRKLLASESSLNALTSNINLSSDKDLIQGLANLMVCRNITYRPAAYKVTSSAAVQYRDGDLVIAIGEEVNDNDDVLAYKDFEETPFLLSQSNALSSTDNIIFIGVGEEPGDVTTPLIDLTHEMAENFGAIDRMPVMVDVDAMRINAGYRYETSNTSEVTCFHKFFIPTTILPNFLGSWHSDYNPRNVSATSINNSTLFSDDKRGFDMLLTDYNSGRSVFNVCWEYDWYGSPKAMVNPCSTFEEHSYGVRCKYSDEWYFLDCGVLSTLLPSVGSHRIITNTKCMFDLFRAM